MSDMVPKWYMQVSVNGQPAEQVAAVVTNYIASNGYDSGDYEINVAGALLRYSTCGTYVVTYEGERKQRCRPRYGSGESAVFNFEPSGGPRIEILSGSPINPLEK